MKRTLTSTSLAVISCCTSLVRAEEPAPPPELAQGELRPSGATRSDFSLRAELGCMRPGALCSSGRSVHKAPALFGLRGGETLVAGTESKASVGIVSQSVSYLTDPKAGFTARTTHFAALGGGRTGLEGGLGLGVGMGLYEPVGEHHGPFSRLGGRGFLLGNDVLYASLLEVPQLELGYQLLDRSWHLELSAHGGAVLTGRYHPGELHRRLGSSFEWGGVLAARLGAVDLDLDWSRVTAGDQASAGSLDVVTALLCGGAHFFGVCFDARFFYGGVPERGASPRVRSVLLGLAVGGLTRDPPRGHD